MRRGEAATCDRASITLVTELVAYSRREPRSPQRARVWCPRRVSALQITTGTPPGHVSAECILLRACPFIDFTLRDGLGKSLSPLRRELEEMRDRALEGAPLIVVEVRKRVVACFLK